MLERDVEDLLRAGVKRLGGICYKFTSPARRNVPDDLVLLPGGVVVFVECKRTGALPTAGQKREHERIRALGHTVYVVGSPNAVEALINYLDAA